MPQDSGQNQTLQIIQQVFALASQGRLSYSDLSTVGKVLLEAENYELATHLYKAWLSHTKSPMTQVVYADLGDVLVAAKDIAGAKTAYQNALQLGGDFERARAALAKLTPA